MAQSCDPKIIAGNGFAKLFQSNAKLGVMPAGLLIDVEDLKLRQVLRQPAFIKFPVARFINSKAIFAQHNDGNGNLSSLA